MLQPDLPQPDRLETLSTISRALSATLDLRALCETIDREIGQIMDATLFSIAILEPDGTSLWLPYGENVSSIVIREGQPLVFANHLEYRRFADSRGLPALNVGEAVLPSFSVVNILPMRRSTAGALL